MYLRELTINGFKSFAKKSELEFSAPITAIVGPNGSGKSNVAESFRFVLGEQSVKSLRGKKGEDLIWGGSEQVSRGNRASVVIELDNTKRVFGLDFDTIKIERLVHRDGQNEYLINDSQVRLKDVQELLAAANIGSTGHHIISQGEADRILSASGRERREMIEDALGLKVYQYKKNEAEKKLDKTKENIEQVESLRRELAPHLKYLKKQVERVEKSLAVQQELKTLYISYLKREDVYLAFHTDRLTAARREPARQLEALQEKLVAAKTFLRNAEQAKDTSVVIEAEETLATTRKAKAELLRSLGALEGEITYINRKISAAEKVGHDVVKQVISADALAELVSTIEQESEKALQRGDEASLRRAITDLVHSLKVFLNRTEPTSFSDTTALRAELSDIESKRDALAREFAAAETAEKGAETHYNQLKQSIETEAVESRQAERAVFELVGEIRKVEITLEHIDRELEVITRDRDEFKRELAEAVALIKSAAAQYFNHEIVENGVIVSDEMIASEDRNLQRERRRELEKLKIRLEELGQGATEDVVDEYNKALERDQFLEREITDLTTSVANLENLIIELNTQLHERFVVGIEKITTEFNRFFVLMFGGGSAHLKRVKPKVKRLTDDGTEVEEDGEETAEGVELDVNLPNKRVKGLDMLSGGERALTSIALIFAMSQINPPLFIILDETDAALDEANSRRYGDMIEALAEKSQLILITHNRETMSRAGILYGVTMGSDGVSKLLSVKFDEAVAVAK
ncbi:MAG: AAA family ATPase [Candidatus Pacebacteria bacterium]|jgi:chromosome segregation protein|nr:AAA family ATPase [Candidatus Paceibacterota bacterium]